MGEQVQFRRAHIPWLATTVGLLVSLLAWRSLRETEKKNVQLEFERRCQVQASLIEISLRAHQEALYSLRNLLQFSPSTSRAQFAGAAHDLITRHGGIQALQWVARVSGAQRAAVEATVQAEGYPDFEFADRKSGPLLQRAPDRPEHFPILYIEPYADNKAALGFDLISGITWPDLQQAAAANRLFSSGRLPLITDGRSLNWGYLLELPVYRDPVPDRVATRPERLRGFVLAVFKISDVLEEAIRTVTPQGLDLLVIDRDAAPDRQRLHYHTSRLMADPAEPSQADFVRDPSHRMIPLPLASRTWELYFRPTPEWLAAQSSRQSATILTGGLLGSLILGFYLRTLLQRTVEVEKQVGARTAELSAAHQLLQKDVRHREEVEARLRESEARLQAILDYSPAIIFVKDLAGRYTFFNRQFAEFCPRPAAEIKGCTDHDLFPAADAEVYLANDREVLAAGRPGEFEESAVRQGKVFTSLVQKFPLLDASGRPYALCGIATDVTGRKQAELAKLAFERNLLETQKLESLGVMAGGIAHDFNNILTVVLGNASLARMALQPGDPGLVNLVQIETAARRAADLCAQMLAYAGKGKLSVGRINLSHLVRDTTSMLEVSIRKNCSLSLNLAKALPSVVGDGAQLNQIVMNLVINASDAIGEQAGGKITVTTFAGQADQALFDQALHRPKLPAGLYAGLEVRDNGCGMPPETIARIFEPFFTTKFSGRGLGLSAVLGIVQGHQGALFVESTPGLGSTFRLLLPTVGAAMESEATPGPPPARQPLRGTVLVVDDEEAVRKVTGEVLRRHGATVLLAADGSQALELFQQQRDQIDLILLDLTMPGLSGEDVLRQLQQLEARQKIVVMSGYSEEETMQRCAALGVVAFLRKPFELQTVVTKLQAYLS